MEFRSLDRHDSRTHLQFELRGPDREQVMDWELWVDAAEDDQGRDLLGERFGRQKRQARHSEDSQRRTVQLRAARRDAGRLALVTGTMQCYVPSLDPEARHELTGLPGSGDGSPEAVAIADGQINITILDRSALPEHAVGETAEGVGGLAGFFGENFETSVRQILAGLADGIFDFVDDRHLLLQIDDPGEMIRVLHVSSADGEILPVKLRMKTGDLHVYELNKLVPDQFGLIFYLNTERSMLERRFEITDVDLP